MPGKINPSITEAAQMTCYKVIWSETTVALCAHWGQLELNTNTPLMIYEVLNSISILTNALNMLREKCIDGITANKWVCRKYAYKSSSLVTILNPIIWYEAAAKLAKEQIKTKQSIVDIILDRWILTEDELHEILRTENLTRPK
jgi:aspartate ammonia-lyase